MYHYIEPAMNEYRTVPLHIFQTWHSLSLPPFMSKCVNQLKQFNPEFTHHLYDDDMCRTFIREHFHADVVHAYEMLIPGAYKADLWRYCILYVYGGVYLDIKYQCIPPFKLIELTKKETYVRDREYAGIDGIYQALMVCYPDNPILFRCIRKIVSYVKDNYYGRSCLFVGPHLVASYLSRAEMAELTLTFNGTGIERQGKVILQTYPEYRRELAMYSKRTHYSISWLERNIYAYKKLEHMNTYTLPLEDVKDLSFSADGITVQTTGKSFHWKDEVSTPLLQSYEKCKFYRHGEKVYEVGLKRTNHGTRVFIDSRLILPTFHSSVMSENIWCMATFHQEPCILYSFYPFIIGVVHSDKLVMRHIHYVPSLFKGLYTSMHSVPWKGAQWVLLFKPTCYIYKEKMTTKQEYIWLVLDEGLTILKYSEFFTVDGVIWDIQFQEEGIHVLTSKKCKNVYPWSRIDSLSWTSHTESCL